MPTATIIESAAKQRAVLRHLLTDLSTGAPAHSVIELSTRRLDGRDLLTFSVAVDPREGPCEFDWRTLSGFEAFAQVMQQAGASLTRDVRAGVSTLEVCMAPPHTRSVREGGYRKGLSVLVVDDDPDVRDVLSELLVTDGHKVQTAADGAEALQHFAHNAFDIVFTDLGMPGISGWQVAEQIKRDSPQVPVVMVTGWGHQLDPAQIERSGVDRVLTKPFQWLKVLDTLQELVPQTAA